MTTREDPATTHVFLRIEHDTAKPEVVSGILGITPNHSVRSGQLPTGGRGEPYPWNVWVLASMWAVQSKDVRAHFQWLLSAIGNRGSELQTLREQGYRMEIRCLWMGRGGYGGPELTPDLLRALSNLGVGVYFDVGILAQSTPTSGGSGRTAQ